MQYVLRQQLRLWHTKVSMMLKSVQTILHPPELKGKDRGRYWLAVGGWFGLMLTCVVMLVGPFVPVGFLLDRWFSPETLRPYKILFFVVMAITGIVAIILSDRLWSRLFIQSGYLSDAAAIRILSNRAPTQTSERRHRWLGQALLLFIYGTLGFMAVMGRQWWVLVIVIPLALWGVFLIRNAWKEADKMLHGGPIPPASEERIRYIEKVLDKRRHSDGGRDENSNA